jgi:putative endonuclease
MSIADGRHASVPHPARRLLGRVIVSGNDLRQTTGREGEALARAELERRGYEILATGFRTSYGELDIIARHGPTLVFVEVRTRHASECCTAVETVTPDKQWHVSRAACAYLVANGGFDDECRFDVVAVDYDLEGAATITVYPDAFDSRY